MASVKERNEYLYVIFIMHCEIRKFCAVNISVSENKAVTDTYGRLIVRMLL